MQPASIAQLQQVREEIRTLRSVISTVQATMDQSLSASDTPGFASDNYSTGYSKEHDLRYPGPIQTGTILNSLPGAHWYRVARSDVSGEISCTSLLRVGDSPLAAQDAAVFPSGSRVLFFAPKSSSYGYIIGILPGMTDDAGRNWADFISPGTNANIQKHPWYKKLIDGSYLGKGVRNWNNNRPIDATSLGDLTYTTALGGLLHLDLFQMVFRISEECGLWMFYLDQLARFSGHNLDIRSAISELKIRDDQGEGQWYEGVTPYPWNAAGFLSPDMDFAENAANTILQTDPVAGLEPTASSRPFYTMEEFKGYLGQGGVRQVQLPPAVEGPYNHYLQTPKTVFREAIGLDGQYSLSSSQSLSIEKRMWLPTPRRLFEAEDPFGDKGDETSNNYKFAGVLGPEGEPETVTNLEPAEDTPDTFTLGLTDIMAHTHNWKILHPFHRHKLDFEVSNPTVANGLTEEENSQVEPEQPSKVTDLQTEFKLPLPPVQKVYVDHRYQYQTYYESKAGIYWLPDGGIVIRDGYGSEIAMSGGHITFSSPGDTNIQSGRSTVLMAGDDLVGKAFNSVDISSSQKDVRVKAEKNLEMLAANSGTGRMLLESKNVRSTISSYDVEDQFGEDVGGAGICLKAETGPIFTYSQDLYLRTLNNGRMVLDSDQGNGSVYIVGNFVETEVKTHTTTAIRGEIEDPSTPTIVSTLSNSGQFLDGNQFVRGSIYSRGGITAWNSVRVLSGHYFSSQAMSSTGGLPVYGAAVTRGELEDQKSNFLEYQSDLKTLSSSFTVGLTDVVQNDFWKNWTLGDATLIDAYSFSFRTVPQYGTETYSLTAPYWWSLDADNEASVWEEPLVTNQNSPTMAYPGYSAWVTETGLSYTNKFVDSETQQESYDPADYSEETVLNEFQSFIPQEGFKITARK